MLKKRCRKFLSIFLSAILVLGLVLVPTGPASAADEYDALRERWLGMLTGGTSYSLSDPGIATRVSQITAEAQGYWDTLIKSPDRVRLWDDAPFGNASSSVTTTYTRLKSMALAYCTYGSTLKDNTALKADIISALDWMNANVYYAGVSKYQNWWHWDIGAPLALNDITVLLYNDLTPAQIANYMNAVDYCQPSATMTGANRMWECEVMALRAVLAKDSVKLAAARDGLSPLFDYVTAGDGFYTDGSFIQHNYFAYNGGYGSSLLEGIANLLYLLDGSTWQVTDVDKENVFKWIYDSYEMFVYKGNLMDMVRGREISRYYSEDNAASHPITASILRLSQIAPSADAAAYKGMVKYWLQADTAQSFFTDASVGTILAANAILNDASIPSRGELSKYKQFARMDRAVQLRPGFGFGISMHSNRTQNYEAINSENNKGWHTSDGMTFLYNSDLGQFNGNFWPTVNSYRLPGTTVLQSSTVAANQSGDKNWVGGTDILGLYGVTGMELHTPGKTLTAKKSWFMFDDEIVALGSGITSTDGVVTESVVENRKLNSAGNNALTVNGAAKSAALGWTETMTGVSTIHLAGNVAGSDTGYYFPGTATVNGLREARTGNWKQINSNVSTPSTPYTNNFLNLWFDHGTNPVNGSYSYVLLPNKTSAQVSSYAGAPHITILENSEEAQAVKENSLNITGVNFWKDAPKTVGIITSNRKAAVMTRETASDMEISVSDPTQANVGTIYMEINKSATGVLAVDSGITITQYHPTVKFTVNVNNAKGKAFKVKFNLTGTPAPNPAPVPVPDPYEAETLPVNAISDSVTVGNNTNASGGKTAMFNANAAGDYVEYSLNVPQPGTYNIKARVMKSSNSGIYQLSVNGVNQGNAVDTFFTIGTYMDFDFGNVAFATAEDRLFRFTCTDKNASASGYKVTLDYIKLTNTSENPTPTPIPTPTPTPTPIPTPTSAPTLYETNDLVMNAISGGDTRVTINDNNASGGTLDKLNDNAVNDFIEYKVNIPQSGTYNVKVRVRKGADSGVCQLSIDGTNQGAAFDCYAAASEYVEVDLGFVTFATAGDKLFRYKMTGKNTASLGYKLFSDYIRLIP